MNIQFLDSKIVPLSTGNRMFTSKRDSLIGHRFSCDEHHCDLNQERVRPCSSGMSTIHRADEGFHQLHKCKSQAKGLVDLVQLPELSGNGSPKSATQFPPRGGAGGVANYKTNRGKHSTTTRSSFPFPSLPSTISRSIPIASSSLKRTASEVQLLEDEAMADYRDFCMYMRIVNGMNERQSWTQLPGFNSGEIQNIIRTRHKPVVEGPSSYMREGLERHSVNSPLNPPKVVKTTTTAKAMAPTLAAPSLTEMTPCYNHTTRKARRTPAIVIQEPPDFIDDNFLALAMHHDHDGKSLPEVPGLASPNVDSPHEGNDESEGVFVMDDV